ncbi:MAG: hypothetical protein GX228_06295 [Firmicutes bacterium]|jgi:ABC-type spermidine/putrescine transport system permease subunit II|nr:hypothetical protein [Bacillota bacterium]NLL88526.1 hypothetical protein [Bacillota bacterium]
MKNFDLKSLKQNALAIPILVWFGLLVGIPMVYVVVVSFLSRDDLGNIVWQFTLDNYRRILDPVYLRIFANSFLLAFLTGVVTLLIVPVHIFSQMRVGVTPEVNALCTLILLGTFLIIGLNQFINLKSKQRGLSS